MMMSVSAQCVNVRVLIKLGIAKGSAVPVRDPPRASSAARRRRLQSEQPTGTTPSQGGGKHTVWICWIWVGTSCGLSDRAILLMWFQIPAAFWQGFLGECVSR